MSWNLAEAVARIYIGGERDLLAHNLNFFAIGFLFDDQFDPDVADRERLVSQTANEMALIPFRPPGAALSVVCPVTIAWQQLWQQMSSRAGRTWCGRFAANFAQWMTAHVWETHLSAIGTTLDVEPYITLRRRSLGLMHSMDLTEWTSGFEVPAAAVAHPLFHDLRIATTDAVAFMNDIHSVEREAAHHDTHNLVLSLQQHQGLSRSGAIERAAAMTQSSVDRFLRLLHEVPAMCAELGLTAAQAQLVDRSVAGMTTWIRGNYDWASHSGRYRPEAQHTPPYVSDLLTPQTGES